MKNRMPLATLLFRVWLGLLPVLPCGCMLLPAGGTLFSAMTTTTALQSTAVNGASYLTTGKGVSDHLISGAANQDCVVLNLAQAESVCKEYDLSKIPVTDKSSRPNKSIEDVIKEHP